MADRDGVRRAPALVIIAVCAVVASMSAVIPAGAASKDEVVAAKAKVKRLETEIDSANGRLAILRADADELAAKIFEAENGLAETEASLAAINEDLSTASRRLDALQERLNEQAATQYMQGPAGTLDMLLGSQSFGELSDRLEYVNAVTQRTTDLANDVAKLRTELQWELDKQVRLREKQRSLVAELDDQRERLFAQLAEQQSLLDEIESKKADAEREAQRLGREYQRELAQRLQEQEPAHDPPATGGSVSGPNPLLVCPVGLPRAYSDGFGAPRYGGGYHPHGGVDIIAPQNTPIYATFPGTVRDASNGLGGISVTVTGSEGWTYNAHLVKIARLGSVNTGDVIGYVGATGDTSTPHNHFEWHPNAIPSEWPASSYGYNVIGSAVNPYPLLAAVC